MLTTKQVDGIICMSSKFDKNTSNDISTKYPFVQCCEYTPYADAPFVMINNEKAAYEATSYLISKGHKKVALITGEFYYSSEKSREVGYKNALSDSNIMFKDEYLIRTSYDYEGGRVACEKLLSLAEPPSGIFCVSDDMAIGVLNYLNQNNIKAGKEIGVIGF